MKDILKMEKWMVKENIFGKKEKYMKVNIVMELKKVMGYLNGIMENFIKENLLMENLIMEIIII
jgi:hypothetical protein